MSNENSTTNAPRRRYIRTGANAPSGRSRKFSCITYLNEMQLKVCLQRHCNQVRVYAYAYHDKDIKEDGELKEPHFHLIIVTHNACSISAIRRWFSGYIDDKGMEITTTAQICSDVFTMYDYLSHSTREAIEQGKYKYDKSIVKSNNHNYFMADEESEYDSITLATESLLNGAKIRDLGRRYGRDFILHYNAIMQYVSDICEWERHPDYTTIDDMLSKRWNSDGKSN